MLAVERAAEIRAAEIEEREAYAQGVSGYMEGYWDINPAAHTTLALHETLRVLGHDDGVIGQLDTFVKPPSIFLAGVILAGIPNETKATILRQSAESVDKARYAGTGRKWILANVYRFYSGELHLANNNEGSFRAADSLYDLWVRCRREIRRPLVPPAVAQWLGNISSSWSSRKAYERDMALWEVRGRPLN